METSNHPLLDQMIGQEMSGVMFIHDYIQIQFNPYPSMSVYSTCRVAAGGKHAEFGDPDFANLIIAQIDKEVLSANEKGGAIVIGFKDSSVIEIPLYEEGLPGGEACIMRGQGDDWQYWPYQ